MVYSSRTCALRASTCHTATKRSDTFEMLGSASTLPNSAQKPLNSAPKSSTRQTAFKAAPHLASSRFYIRHLSLKYKYKDRARED